MSAYIKLTDTQVELVILEYMGGMSDKSVELFLLRFIKEVKMWKDIDWEMVRSKLPKEKTK